MGLQAPERILVPWQVDVGPTNFVAPTRTPQRSEGRNSRLLRRFKSVFEHEIIKMQKICESTIVKRYWDMIAYT